jgi:hypothetical protein
MNSWHPIQHKPMPIQTDVVLVAEGGRGSFYGEAATEGVLYRLWLMLARRTSYPSPRLVRRRSSGLWCCHHTSGHTEKHRQQCKRVPHRCFLILLGDKLVLNFGAKHCFG